MSSEELTTIAQIVANYTNPDQKIRSESEKYISNLRNNSMGAVCFCLLKVTTLDNISTTTKLTSLVLLRKIINVDSKDKWGDMDEQTKESIKSLVLDLFIKETDLNVKSKYCDVITEIVDNTADYNEKWPKLVELSYSLNKYDINDSNNVLIVESLIKMITDSSGFLYEDITKKYDEFLMFFDKVFKTCNFIQLKVRTAKIISELLAFGDKKENEQLKPYIFNVLETTLLCFNNNDELNLISMLDILIDISSFESKLLAKHFNDIIILTSKLTTKTDYSIQNSQKIRELSFEFVISIVESIPSLFVKDINNLKLYLDLLYKYALESETSNKEWSTPSAIAFSDLPTISEDNVRFTESIIDRLNSDLNNEVFIPILSEVVTALVSKDSTHCKYVGLLSLSQVICYADNMKSVESIIPFVFNMLKHSDMKVRFAAANCIDELATTFQDEFTSKYVSQILPIIIEVFDIETIPRVQCEVLVALVSFINFTSEVEILLPYIQPIITTIVKKFENVNTIAITKKEILITISEIIKHIEESCQSFSKNLMELLMKYLNEYYVKKTNLNLIPNLLYSITLLGLYEKESLLPIIPSLIKCIIELIDSLKSNINPMRSQIQSTLEHLIPLIHNNYNQFIPLIIQTLFKLLHFTSMTSSINEENISSSTAEVDDIVDCVKLLNTVIENLEEDYYEYYQNTEQVVFKMLKEAKNYKLKRALMEVLGNLIKVLYAKKENCQLKQKAEEYIKIFFVYIDKELDIKLCAQLIEILNQIIENSAELFEQSTLEQLFERIIKELNLFEERRVQAIKNQNKRENEYEEEKENKDDDTESNDEEESRAEYLNNFLVEDIINLEEIECRLIESIESILKANSKGETQKFAKILQILIETTIPSFLSSERTTPLLLKYPNNFKLAALTIDNIFENFELTFKPEVMNYLLSALLLLSTYNVPSIRQAALYGLGIFIKKSPNELYEMFSSKIYPKLKEAITSYTNKKRDEGLAYDNAVASIGKGIGYKNFIDKEYIQLWLSNLPIKYDSTEKREQNEILSSFILQNKYTNLIDSNQLTMIIIILVNVYGTHDQSSATINKMILEIFKKAKEENVLRGAIDTVYNSNESIKKKMEEMIAKA